VTKVLLADRQIFKIFGNDKEKFLQGLLTCDVRDRPCYGALLSPAGRFLYDFFIVEEGDHWLMDIASDRSDEILKKLNLYKLKSDVRFEKDDRQVWWSSKSDTTTEAIMPDRLSDPDRELISYKDPRHPQMGYRSYKLDPDVRQDISAFLNYTDQRISQGIPEGPLDLIYDRSIILECNFVQMNAVSFTKGCYVGQELIARTHHTGTIRKRLMPLNLQQDQGKHKELYRSFGKRYTMAMMPIA
jgi:folate-binding protein YgfZ